jgi:hypothetical protein
MHDASKRTVHMHARNSAGPGKKSQDENKSDPHLNYAALANGDSLISKKKKIINPN